MNAPEIDGDAPSAPGRSRRRVAFAVGAGALSLAALGYVGACVHYKDSIADGTTVAGKSIGGMTRTQAARQISGLQHPQAGTKAHVTAGGQTFDLAVGPAWKADAAATLDDVTGFSLSPKRLIDHLWGSGHDITPVFRPDTKQLAAIVDEGAEAMHGAARDGKVEFVDGAVRVIGGTGGRGVDGAKLTQQIATGWPGRTDFSASVVTKGDDEENRAVMDFARGDAKKAMSGPLTVTANGDSVTMQPKDVSAVISSTTGPDGKLHLKVDTKAFLSYVLSHSTDMQKDAAVDAKIIWKDGKPSVQDGKVGREIDTKLVEKEVADALVGNHRAELAMTEMKPQVTADDLDANALPTTSMAHFESKFPLGDSQKTRIHNITTAINRLNGQVVLPGEQFSLLRALGYNFSKESGYEEAGTLQNGVHVDGQGGGVSQVSTTVYNTAFFAGVQLDEHTSHIVYLERYPMGREATLWNPGVDNTWTNDTGHPILIKAHVDTNKVVMDFYGTKRFEVSTRTGPKEKVKQPKRRTIKNVKGCENTIGKGTPGFEVDVWRALKQGDKTVRTDKIHTVYQPDDIITCEGKTS